MSAWRELGLYIAAVWRLVVVLVLLYLLVLAVDFWGFVFVHEVFA